MKNRSIAAAAAIAVAASSASAATLSANAFTIDVDGTEWEIPTSVLTPGGPGVTPISSGSFTGTREFDGRIANASTYDDFNIGDPVNAQGIREVQVTADFNGDSVQTTKWGFELVENDNVVMQFTDLFVEYDSNPGITLNINAIGTAANSTVSLDSANLTFANINSATADAAVAVALLDSTFVGTDGATFSPAGGTPSSPFAYTADTNVGNFAELLTSDVNIAPAAPNSTVVPDSFAGGIAGTTNSAQTGLRFTVTEGDIAAVTSEFDIVPTPASASLVALAGLTAARRRRA